MSAIPINKASWSALTVTCTLANTAYQGPNLVVDDDFALLVRYRHVVPGNPLGFVGPTAATVLVSATRVVLQGGEAVTLGVQNGTAVFVASDTALTIFEFVTEQ